ncbi:hypothetical protein AHMF7605_22440 [Adhaeribacter arboris]|uniref:Serine protease n=1 Tax=Adhaeribacter arboris TaxID=2072846 RepID=A0A2T2YKN1_9BACT|nr:hypothetical protein [Adhaeribacter arboris]PSR56060.1 hypothetical protein AHMF7605_22440 [Adhaeribacter arboris]
MSLMESNSNGQIEDVETDATEANIDTGGLQIDAAPADKQKADSVSAVDVINSTINGFSETGTEALKAECYKVIKKYLKQTAKEHLCCDTYNVLILHDNGALVKGDADRIYNAVTDFPEKKPILLILYSPGGDAGSAYLIGKLCIDNSGGRFIIAVPRMAKSAATLICCAANEIHMGSLSELGPIDPQINELPALGLKNSVEHIAELVKNHPASSEMFANYLNSSLPLIHLGYYERVAESAMQYAEKLLNSHRNELKKDVKGIANELVYKYKDHSFVIDKSEAEEIFGSEIIKTNTPEYELGNSLYSALTFINRIADMMNHNFYFTGSFESDPVFTKKRGR